MKAFIFRHIVAFCCMAMCFTIAIAQQEETPSEPESQEEKNDTTVISWGRKGKMIIIKDSKGNRRYSFESEPDNDDDDDDDYDDDNWVENDDDDGAVRKRRSRYYSRVGVLAMDLGVANYYNDGNFGAEAANQDLEVKSFRPASHVALHFLPTTVSLFGRGVVNLKTAITIDYTQFYFENDIKLIPKQDVLTWERTGINYDRNKLTARYAQIPLLLNFDTTPGSDRGVSLSVGGYAGVLWESHTKQKSEEEGKEKIRDDFNLNKFRYGLTARLDFRWFDFYFNMALSELFEEESGLGAQSFTAGLNIINF